MKNDIKIRIPKGKDSSEELRTKIFIHNSNIVHNNLYDYSLSKYISNKGKVKIICKDHGIFEQSANGHIGGRGCAKCTTTIKSNTKDFINKSKIIHNDIYNYSLVDYISNSIKVKIICKDHGIFEQQPKNHLIGRGCLLCSGKARPSTQDFINKSKITHGDNYDYSLVEYTNAYKKVKIICKDHGVFEQSARKHTQGQGCPECVFNDNQQTFLYILKNEHNQFKIGITINTESRINQLTRTNPFKLTQVTTYDFNKFSSARKCESLIHQKLKKYNIKFDDPFDGYTEWFSCTFEQATEAVNKYYKNYSLLEDI